MSGLGDAQIQNLLGRFNAFIERGGGGALVSVDGWSTPAGQGGWARVSAPATLTNVAVASEICIEVSGTLNWAQRSVSFAACNGPDIANPGVVAEAKINGDSIRLNLTMAWHCMALFTVTQTAGLNQMRCHVSGAIAPAFPGMSGGDPGAGVLSNFNAIPFEGDQSINFGVVRRFFVGAAFDGAAGGQQVAASRTKISYYGG